MTLQFDPSPGPPFCGWGRKKYPCWAEEVTHVLSQLERTTWGRVLLYLCMVPFVMIAAPIQFAIQYVIERQFDICDL